MKDAFGDRMKMYERREAGRQFLPKIPVVARMDGRGFHRFTKHLARPFDENFRNLMIELTKYLVEETSAKMGYTQSDEISLLFYSDDLRSQIYFNGKVFKMISSLSATTSVMFNELKKKYDLPEYLLNFPATFDCRVWEVPTKHEAVNVFMWREFDAVRNSITMAAQNIYSHKQLHKKNTDEMQEMLFQKGINWNDYDPKFKRGTYVQKQTVERSFTAEDLAKLPPKHNAHKNPDLKIKRTVVDVLEMPPINKVENRVDVFFEGDKPKQSE